jgi:hypothetical protein
MKRKLLILLLIVSSYLLCAQAPDWQWATKAGGSDYDWGFEIAIDANDNSFITGGFEDTAIFGLYSLTSSGDCDVFVGKLDTNGNWLWATKAGGSGYDLAWGIAIDDNGNSFITGWFEGTASFGPYSLTSSGSWDIFIAKMDTNGNWLWATKAGGSGYDWACGIATDNNGNSYVTGGFEDTAIFGPYSLTSSGDCDIFVGKLDTNGNWLWAARAGGNYEAHSYTIGIDENGNSYVTGWFTDTMTFGSYSLTSCGYHDIFVAKMDAYGNWIWVTQAGGTELDHACGIAIDNIGNSYITGWFFGTATFGTYSLTSSGDCDIFVGKLDTNGNWLWSAQAGGSYSAMGKAITVDNAGRSYVTGHFQYTSSFGSYSITSNGDWDVFVTKMDTNGNWLWAIQAGGSIYDFSEGIAINDNEESYVTGRFACFATFGSYSLTGYGNSDIFVAKLGNDTSAANEIIPPILELSNYPNPFNPTTTISFSISNDVNVELSIYNMKGQKIKTLAHNEFAKGSHSIIWNGDNDYNKPVSSGVYLYKLKVNGKTEAVRKCLLLK